MSIKTKKDLGVSVRVLQIVSYEKVQILIRMFPSNIYIWDFQYKDKFYSGHIIISPEKGKTKLSDGELKEVIKMLYAGAAATIDHLMGKKLSSTDERIVKQFESAIRTGGEA